MPPDEYSTGLGRILGNFQSLELCVRIRLSYDDPPSAALPGGMVLQSLRVGDEVPVNSLTSFESLNDLITRYNNRLPEEDADCRLDPTVVAVRDALAHGRVSSQELSSDMVLLKFDRPRDNRVTVTFAQRLTRDWLGFQIRRVHDEVLKAMEAMSRERKRRQSSRR